MDICTKLIIKINICLSERVELYLVSILLLNFIYLNLFSDEF